MHRLAFLGALLLTPGMTLADTTASKYAGGGFEQGFIGATGWYFTPGADVSVTQLGILDLDDPGLIDAHTIGIFRATDESAVITTTIASGLGGELIDGTRFVDVAPVRLDAGVQYYIVADMWRNDNYAFGNGLVTFAPEIAWDGFATSPNNDIFSEMENLGGFAGNLGPNFRFVVVPAPASAWGVLAFGLVCGRRRR